MGIEGLQNTEHEDKPPTGPSMEVTGSKLVALSNIATTEDERMSLVGIGK